MNAASMMNGTDVNMDEVSDILSEYQKVIQEGTASLTESLQIGQELLDKLTTVSDRIKSLTGMDSYEDILNAMATDPAFLAEFVSSPVDLETVSIYPVNHYGSAASPFYTILAIWVGALFLVAIVHVTIEPENPEENPLVVYKTWERYFGRYLLFFLVGQAQTLLTILGNLYYIQIQCQHPFLYWLAAAIASTAFSCFMYSVTFAFGNVGEALAIIVMVIQVAGSGGTFPIEVAPGFFRAVYPLLPFTHSMAAMREAVGGVYGMDYWMDLGKLGVFLIVSLVVGLVLRRPIIRMNDGFTEKLEETKLI